ncbi:Uma2 family endonuclease [Streptomyces sp. UNOC14_S4]|uniref:Uma2 family endonuclease n=1 Tax=Streptomyces sp. UNOC14_S4 TaxID=2872340 RepID=UPI001E575463|nr:Uma2 family endonuclease [Streptomyces sp. UNOC14_S4]MCC3769725.1 Uma2 family endonuclease [Streptomyces sp. UNOC14_S4]
MGRETYEHLRAFAERFVPSCPLSARVEVGDGRIVLTASPGGRHGLAALRIGRQLRPQLPDGIVATTSGDIEEPGLGQLRRPDVLVLPEAAMDTDDPISPRALLAAVEIVSPSNPENDYESKLRHYPQLGIPHYLIVDPRDGTCVHHWAIGAREGTPVYEARVPYVFGDKISIGEWVIDTGELPRYGPDSR